MAPTPASLGQRRLVEHVERLGEQHPPIDLATVDFTVNRPELLSQRFGHVLDYMARVELEVDRNVLELLTLLPDPPEVDRLFYADVWQPQEIRHGEILDELQTPIRRQEPGHYAFYKMSAQGLAAELSAWQRWLVRRLRRLSYGPVGVNNTAQLADFGDVMLTLGIDEDLEAFTESIARVERDLSWARGRGLPVPDYVVAAFRDAVEAARSRQPLDAEDASGDARQVGGRLLG